MAGLVFSKERKLEKAGQQVAEDIALDLRGQDHPWVSRGGLKLAHALEQFNIVPAGMTCIDVGASTGGFTDVLLQNGAARVYAVDVGNGQLAWKLRSDDRVVILEKSNARYLTSVQIPEAADMVVCDASFIGLRTVLPASMERVKPGGYLIAREHRVCLQGGNHVESDGSRAPSVPRACCPGGGAIEPARSRRRLGLRRHADADPRRVDDVDLRDHHRRPARRAVHRRHGLVAAAG